MIDWIIAHSHYFLLLMIFAALKQEIARGFTGRPSLVANTSSILAVAGPFWGSLPVYIHWWVLIGVPVCIIAFLSYVTEISLPTEFYSITWILYNSAFAAVFILLAG